MRDLYQILGVGRSASTAEIKKAFRRIAHKLHPDKNPDDPTAEERFKEATLAYEILSDADKRRRYDRDGLRGVKGHAAASPPRPTATEAHFGDVFSEIFSDLFSRRRKRTAVRGADREYTLGIDFKTAVFGGERVVEVPRAATCERCAGTGTKPGTSPQICYACGGTGELRAELGPRSSSRVCGYCQGRGKLISHPCADCSGTGLVRRRSEVKVRIPMGAADGLVLRYRGAGEPGIDGGPAGDLRVVLNVSAHAVFRREGCDLYCDVPVTLAEAALGSHIEVPTLDGTVRMTLPPGTRNGSVFRLRGKGGPQPSGEGHGDLHVTVTIETPQGLDERERALVGKLTELDRPEHYPERAAFWRRVKSE